MSLQQGIVMLLAIMLPNAAIVGLFSTAGVGIKTYNAVSLKLMDMAGKGLVACSSLTLVLFYVFQWDTWSKRKQRCSMMLPVFGFAVSSVLVGRTYPWAPLITCLLLIPFSGGVLRFTICSKLSRNSFYSWFSFFMLLCSSVVTTIWLVWMVTGDNYWNESTRLSLAKDASALWEAYPKIEDGNITRYMNYTLDCGRDKDVSRFSSDQRTEIGTKCKEAVTVLFTSWASCLMAAMGNLFLAAFAASSGIIKVRYKLGPTDCAPDAQKWEAMLKRFLGLLALIMMGMYFSCSIAGASIQMGSTLMAFFASALSVLVIAMYVELGGENMKGHLRNSKLSQMIFKAWLSDWSKAVFIGAFNVCLPCFLLLNMLRQKCTKGEKSQGSFTPFGSMMVEQFKTWNWASILQKICLLGELFFTFQVGVAKATYVFLSWLNYDFLSDFSYVQVVVIIFFIGYLMFLLPPVPGVPVYVFCGIVVAEKGRQDGNYALGCVVACVLAWLLKLAACTGQYMIGYCAGKTLYVKALIGVDKVFTRAIEKILKDGPGIGKVAVLVGGPDWPTSVTCGILGMSIPAMLLGTAPVFFVSSPCVLAGAFLARVVSGEDSIWSALANTFMGLMGICQMACGCLAVQQVTRVIDHHGADLAKPRPEHADVEALSKKTDELAKAYIRATEWSRLGCCRKCIICLAAGAQLLSGFLFAMGGEYCFESFSVSSRISDPYEENGLDNKPHTIVKPAGMVALGLFAVGTIFHVIFAKDTARLAKRYKVQPIDDAE